MQGSRTARWLSCPVIRHGELVASLGAVIYYLRRGTPPPPATARAVQDDESLLTTEQNPGFSSQFLSAIEWALAVRPAERPQSIA